MANHSRDEAEKAGMGLLGIISSLLGLGVKNIYYDNKINEKSNEYFGLGKLINYNEIEDLKKKKRWPF